MVQRKNLFLCLASIAVLATAILGTMFVVLGVRADSPELTDEQKVYNFLVQEYEGKTNAQRLGITNLTDKSTWTWLQSSMRYGFMFNADGDLTEISIGGKGLYGSLDVSGCMALTTVTCHSNKLTELDVSNNTELTVLSCHSNQLIEVNTNDNTKLTSFDCGNNRITELDVTKNTELTYLGCGKNQLTELDVRQNTRLTRLLCFENQLTELDVSHNISLTSLDCPNNLLTELDVSYNTNLTALYCDSNQLTELDVSNNTQLNELWYFGNQLVHLNISGCIALTRAKYGSNFFDYYNLTTGPLAGHLSDETISSFMLFPYVDGVDGETYARASVNGYELNIKFDIPFTAPEYIFATIAINEFTDEIYFNTYVQTSYPFYGCTSDGSVTGITHQTDGGWEKFTGTFNSNSMNVTLHYNPLPAGEHEIVYNDTKDQPHENPTTYTEGETITLDALTETVRYTFDGWFDAPEGGEQVTSIPADANEDIVLWARWTAKIFNIVYNSTIPIENNSNPEIYTCENGTITLAGLDDTDDYKFEGWFDAAEGGSRIESFDADEIGGKVFYAQWSEKTGTTDPGTTDPGTDPNDVGGVIPPGKPNIYLWGGIGLLVLALLLALLIYFGAKRYGKKKELRYSAAG